MLLDPSSQLHLKKHPAKMPLNISGIPALVAFLSATDVEDLSISAGTVQLLYEPCAVIICQAGCAYQSPWSGVLASYMSLSLGHKVQNRATEVHG